MALANYDLSVHKQRVDSEQEWRLALKTGDQIDAVKFDQVRNLIVSSWSRAIVTYVGLPEEGSGVVIEDDCFEGLVVKVKYIDDRTANKRQFLLSDWHIAPLSTFTKDWDWRYKLEVGDTIDCMDEEKEWYKSTVLAKRLITNTDGDVVPEIQVGFRTFDPEGSKTDEDGRTYFGWSERFDAWHGVTDV